LSVRVRPVTPLDHRRPARLGGLAEVPARGLVLILRPPVFLTYPVARRLPPVHISRPPSGRDAGLSRRPAAPVRSLPLIEWSRRRARRGIGTGRRLSPAQLPGSARPGRRIPQEGWVRLARGPCGQEPRPLALVGRATQAAPSPTNVLRLWQQPPPASAAKRPCVAGPAAQTSDEKHRTRCSGL
jgi:hypothetical protein